MDVLFKFMKWRVVLFEKVATLQEVETYWDFKDLIDANKLLDAKAKIFSALLENVKGATNVGNDRDTKRKNDRLG